MYSSCNFGRKLSVGTFCFEDRFTLAKKVRSGEVGGHSHDMVAVERHWPELAGLLSQMSVETAPLPL